MVKMLLLAFSALVLGFLLGSSHKEKSVVDTAPPPQNLCQSADEKMVLLTIKLQLCEQKVATLNTPPPPAPVVMEAPKEIE